MKLTLRIISGLLLVFVLLYAGSGITQQAYNLIEGNGTPAGMGSTLNFPNTASVTWSCSTSGGVTSCSAASTGSGGGYTTIQNNGTSLPQEPILNFTSGVTCVDDSGTTSTNCSASGGGVSKVTLSQANAIQNTTAPASLMFQNNVVSGDILTIQMGWACGSTMTAPSATDTVGTSYSVVQVFNNGSGSSFSCTGTLAGAAGGSGANTVTPVWPSGASYANLVIAEWIGLSATADGSGGGTGLTPSDYQTVTLMAGTAGDLVLSVTNSQGNGAVTECAGAIPVAPPTSGGDTGIACYTIINSPGIVANPAYVVGVASGAGIAALKSK